jgi:hypothetical protein
MSGVFICLRISDYKLKAMKWRTCKNKKKEKNKKKQKLKETEENLCAIVAARLFYMSRSAAVVGFSSALLISRRALPSVPGFPRRCSAWH